MSKCAKIAACDTFLVAQLTEKHPPVFTFEIHLVLLNIVVMHKNLYKILLIDFLSYFMVLCYSKTETKELLKEIGKEFMKILQKMTSLLLVLVLLISTFSMTACELFFGAPKVVDPISDNYRTFYQIFVGSFSDSNGDGVGDLRGIINRLDYLNDGDINSGNDLGIQGIWLSPIFESPSYHKYDAEDYYKIDEQFGTMDDLKELLELCHQRNVKVILDLVINHSSSRNDWFLKFKEARLSGDTESKYYDYYSCVKGSEKSGKSSYTSIGGDWWYESNFSSEMPELNFDNPVVRDDMLSLAKFYLDMGIDGFRFDAVKYIYFGNTEKSVDFWKWYMKELTAYKPDIYCVGECWSSDSETLEYITAMNCFNFTTSGGEGKIANVAKGSGISGYLNYVENYQDKVQEANPLGMPMTFLTNHDMDRIAGVFFLENNMKMAANLYLLSPGSPMIYYGEEIGLLGSRGAAMTDANRRLAMLWGDGDKIQNPIGATYDSQIESSVKDQLKDNDSLLNYYSKLIAIRHKYPAIARGDYNAVTSNNINLGGFYIEYNGEVIGLFHNNSTETITVRLSELSGLDGHTFARLYDCIGIGDASLNGDVLTVEGQTSVIVGI